MTPTDPLNTPPDPSETTSDSTPYRGLASYDTEHHGWYFGRKKLTYTVVSRLHQSWAKGTGPVALVGPSGSGKSSLLAAGVIPALRRDEFGTAGDTEWPAIVITPGPDPVKALASGLAAASKGDEATPDIVDDIVGDLYGDPVMAAFHVQQAASSAGADGMLLVIDQLEEIFTEGADDNQRWTLLAAAQAMSTAGQSRATGSANGPAGIAVFGLRADFYHRALREPQLFDVLQRNQVVVTPMTEPELHEAIVEPARRANITIEDGLPEVMLDELTPSGEPTVAAHPLPLLSHALLTTRQLSAVGRMTFSGYRRSGGIGGSVARSADSVVEGLNAPDRALARRILSSLVQTGPDGGFVRRRRSRSEINALADGGDSGDRVAYVISVLTENRLITDESGDVQIIHESLAAAWPRLRNWVDETESAGRSGPGGPATPRDAARTANSPKATRRRPTRPVAALTAITVVAVTAGVVAFQQRDAALDDRAVALDEQAAALEESSSAAAARDAAVDERDAAQSRLLAADAERLLTTEPALARQLALSAYQMSPTAQARSALVTSASLPAVGRVSGAGDPLSDLAISEDGSLLAGRTGSGNVVLWDATADTPSALVGKLPDTSDAAAVSLRPDGQLIAVANSDGVAFYDISDPAAPTALPGVLEGVDGEVHALAFSPDGSVLAAGGSAGKVWLWDVADVSRPDDAERTRALTKPSASVTSLAFSPDGNELAAGSADDAVYRWDVADHDDLTMLSGGLGAPAGDVLDVEYHPSDNILVAASADGQVYRWQFNGDNTDQIEPLDGASGAVRDVAFSSDGAQLAAGTNDRALVWNADSGGLHATLRQAGPVASVIYGDGSWVTASDDGVVRSWQPDVADDEAAFAFARVADGDVALVSGTDAPQTVSVTVGDSSVEAAGLDAEGRILATAASDVIQLWDVADPENPTELGEPLTGITDRISAVAVAPSGDTLAVATLDGIIQIWDITNSAKVADNEVVAKLNTSVQALAFAPTGDRLAAADTDRTVHVWELSEPGSAVLYAVLTGTDTKPQAVSFDATGNRIAIDGGAGAPEAWSLDAKQATADVCETLGTPITQAEWEQHVPGLPYSPPCDSLS